LPRVPTTCYVPSNLDLARYTRPKWVGLAEWICSLLYFRRFTDRSATESSFLPLSKAFLLKFVPHRTRRPLLNDLLLHAVLESDGKYYFGPAARGGRGKCLCYRFGPEFRSAKPEVRLITDPVLIAKLQQAYRRERDEVTDPLHRRLRGWHDRVQVLPDAPFGEDPLLDRLIEGERRFTVCEQGRVHTNVSNLPAQYRQFVRVDGHELASVDVSTSQPLLLAITLLGRTRTPDPREGAAGGRALEEGRRRQRGGGIALLVRAGPDLLAVYLADCLAGRVYDRIVEVTGYPREAVKSMFLAVIYGEPQHMHTLVGKAIQKLYPVVFEAVIDLNYSLGHGGLPRLLQTVESSVMIGRIARRLLTEAPKVPLLTVHDCILTPPEHVERVERAIREEWLDEFGVAPQTKRSMFTDPQHARVHRRRTAVKN